jgi:hypothetical protein
MNKQRTEFKAGRKASRQTQWEASAFSICTPNNPFGRSGTGSSASIGPASPLSRSQAEYEQEMIRQEAELGSYFVGPVLMTAELVLKGGPAMAMTAYRFFGTLREHGTGRQAADQAIELAISVAIDAAAQRSRILKANEEFLKKLAGTIAGAVIDKVTENKVIKKAQTEREPGDSAFASRRLDKWDSDQDKVQAGVDRYEERQRNFTGSMIA